jgi:hypothetical protein
VSGAQTPVIFVTVEQSLSFDTIMKRHSSRADAEAHMVKTLVEAGWERTDAKGRAANSKPVLVYDDGDDHTIEIRELA